MNVSYITAQYLQYIQYVQYRSVHITIKPKQLICFTSNTPPSLSLSFSLYFFLLFYSLSLSFIFLSFSIFLSLLLSFPFPSHHLTLRHSSFLSKCLILSPPLPLPLSLPLFPSFLLALLRFIFIACTYCHLITYSYVRFKFW